MIRKWLPLLMLTLFAQTIIGQNFFWSHAGVAVETNTYLDSLIAVYEFDETSGTTAYDAYADYDGTIDGATINQTGKVDKAYDFDGINDLVNTTLSTHYTEFSFSCWIYLDGWGKGSLGRILEKREAGTSTVGLYVDGSKGNNRIAFYQNRSTDLGQWRTESSTLSLSNWYHICVTYDNSSVDNDAKIYINGTSMTIVEANTPSGTVVTNTDDYIIGNRGAKDRSFNGKIDQPAFWKRILTPGEVAGLYNSGNGVAYAGWDTITVTEPEPEEDADLTALNSCLTSSLIYEGELSFTPVSDYYSNSTELEGSGICEDDSSIFIVFNHTIDNDYKYHMVWKYNKFTADIDTQRIITENEYCCNVHKRPVVHVTDSGKLLVAIPNLITDAVNTRIYEIFRWSDPSDLTTYTSTKVGTFSTDLVSYPMFFEVNDTLYFEAKDYNTSNPKRKFYKSTDDGQTFGAVNEYLNYSDADWWMYAFQVGNNIQNGDTVYMGVMPTYVPSSTTYWKYGTLLKTDFTNFYTLDGTDLGATISRTELENNKSWGLTAEDTDSLYYTSYSKLIGSDIYAIVRAGTRPGGGGSNMPVMRMIKTNVTTGTVTTGDTISTIDGSWEVPVIFNMCDSLYVKTINGGDVNYYKFGSDINTAKLVKTETGSWSYYMIVDMYSELTADYNSSTNKIRIYRFDDPDGL